MALGDLFEYLSEALEGSEFGDGRPRIFSLGRPRVSH